jgi:hypothetical protein
MTYGPRDPREHYSKNHLKIGNKAVDYIEPLMNSELKTYVVMKGYDRIDASGSRTATMRNEDLFPIALGLLEYAIHMGFPSVEEIEAAVKKIHEILERAELC